MPTLWTGRLSAAARRVFGHDDPAGERVCVFGGHTLAWLVRAIFLYRHDSKTFREAKISTQEGGEWFTRFLPFDRFLHFLVVTSFLLLVITGMPLKFYYTGWAKVLFGIIGGPETARAFHRLGAIVTFIYFGLHVTSIIDNCWQGRGQIRDPETRKFSFKRLWKVLFGPDSMVPTCRTGRISSPITSGSSAKAKT